MKVEFQCRCGQLLRADDENAGKKARCPRCLTLLTVPQPPRNVYPPSHGAFMHAPAGSGSATAEPRVDPGNDTQQPSATTSAFDGQATTPNNQDGGGTKGVGSLVLGIIASVAWLLPCIGFPITVAGLCWGVCDLRSNRRRANLCGIALCCVFLLLTGLNAAVGLRLSAPSDARDAAKGPPPNKTHNRPQVSTLSTENATATCTKKTWDRIELINLEVRSYTNDPLQYWRQNYLRYGQLELDNVDSELCTLCQDWIRVSVKISDLLSEFAVQRERLDQQTRAAADFGARVGAMDNEHPQRSAAAGAVLFGLLGSAAADSELQTLTAKYEPRYQALMNEANEINGRRDAVARTLSQRYRLTFRTKL